MPGDGRGHHAAVSRPWAELPAAAERVRLAPNPGATTDRENGVLTVSAVRRDVPFTPAMAAAIDAEIAALACWLSLDLRRA